MILKNYKEDVKGKSWASSAKCSVIRSIAPLGQDRGKRWALIEAYRLKSFRVALQQKKISCSNT